LGDSYKLEGVPPAYAEFTRVDNGCVVRLVLDGLAATTKFWQEDGYALGTGPYGGGIGLAAFLSELAENWRGWQGVKSWSDFENTLSIQAEHDGLGHITLTFEMRRSQYDGWRLTGPLPVEAGALDRLAATARRFDAA
jgi:hypothetical protein